MGAEQKQIPLGSPAPPKVLASKLEKPDLDDRSYRVIQLGNKLEALIVHDQHTDKASASLAVHVGSFSDGEDLPGQAHAVEHLLFLGTEKYPKENDYSQFLAEHSGFSNAYTSTTETNYYFEVGHEHLHGALDRFAQFFIAPLFLADCVDRELRAVDSENKKNLQQDQYRIYQLGKSLSNPKHPYCHFATGNLDTLRDEPVARGINVRDEFIKFHGKWYSANGMKLVVLGRQDLDSLQQWVVDMFSPVKNKEVPTPKFEGQPFTEKELLTQCFAKTVMDSKSLEITFPFMDEEQLYTSHPSRYASHLIGHEGPGSILAYLKQKGWVLALNAGASPVCTGTAFFVISLTLTEEGLDNYEEIVKVIFQYINLIKQTPVQEWVFKELQIMTQVDFKFLQKNPASRFTSRLSPVMHKPLPREWLLSGSLIREYNPTLIKKAMEYLTPDNFRLTISSKNPIKGKVFDMKEKWYGTEYTVEKIPLDFLNQIRKTVGRNAPKPEELHFPHKNEFIPTNLEVVKKEVKEPAKAPTLIKNNEMLRVWYKKDDTFWVPKANLYITMRNPLVYASPANSMKTKFYCELVRDALNEYSYDAEIAGLDYHLTAGTPGFDLEIEGYNDKMSVLLEKVLLKMRDLEVTADRFKVVKDWMTRAYKNWEFAAPYHQIREYMKHLTLERFWLNEEHLQELELLTMEDVASFAPQVLKQMHIEVLAHGNLQKEDALRLSHQVEQIFKPRVLPHSQFANRRSFILPPGSKYFYPRLLKDPENVNSCIEYFLFLGELSDRALRARLSLFSQMTSEPAFDQLRTKEQLGYVVFSGGHVAQTTMSYRVLVQSERSAAYLEGRIEKFLEGFKENLEKMTDKDFENHVNSLLNQKQEKLKNLMQESERYWSYIGNEYYDFRQIDEEVSVLRNLTKSDMQAFYNHYISPSSPHRAKLSIHLLAEKSTAKNTAASGNPLTTEQQKQTLVQTLTQLLNAEVGIKSEPEVLSFRFKDVNIADEKQVSAAVRTYLLEDENVEMRKVGEIVAKGEGLLKGLLPQFLGMSEGAADDDGEGALKESTVIEDVVAWKSGLELSRAARPVRPLVEYEIPGVKL